MGGDPAPGPRGTARLAAFLEMRRDRLGFFERQAARYGDVAELRIPGRRLILLRHPEHARHVLRNNAANYRKGLGLEQARRLIGRGLLTSEGARWEERRELLHGAFRQERIQAYAPGIAAAAEAMLARWDREPAGRSTDVAGEMARLTLDVVGRTLVRSARIEGLAEDFGFFGRWLTPQLTAAVMLPLAVPTPRNLRAARAIRRLRWAAEELIAERRRRPSAEAGGAGDLLDLLLAPPAPGAGPAAALGPGDVREELLTFLLVGHETSAAALCWIWVLLSQCPEAAERLRAELAAELGGRSPALADLPRLGYTRQVIQEALRLYPPVWAIPRRALADDEIGGVRIPAGAQLLLAPYSIHRHPQFWEAPGEFRPERFAPELAGAHAPCSYMPFGYGARACLGSSFAMQELQIVVAAVAQRYAPELAPGRRVTAAPGLTLVPAGGLPMALRRIGRG